jgi:hypothetical protein
VSSWADHNVHDPGITLLELLAYVGDQLAYYQDQIAAENRLRTRRRVAVGLAAGALALVVWRCRLRSSERDAEAPRSGAPRR